jgi:hypothetical protein
MLRTRFGDTPFRWRRRAVRTPSRDKKRVVESSNSNCTVAVPKVCGVASRTRAWLRTKVSALEASCKKTSEDIDVRDAASKLGEGAGTAWGRSVVDMGFTKVDTCGLSTKDNSHQQWLAQYPPV